MSGETSPDFCPGCHLKVAPQDPDRVRYNHVRMTAGDEPKVEHVPGFAHRNCVRRKNLLKKTTDRFLSYIGTAVVLQRDAHVLPISGSLAPATLARLLNTRLNTAYEAARLKRDLLAVAAQELGDGIRKSVRIDIDGLMREIEDFAKTATAILRHPVVISDPVSIPELTARGKQLAKLKARVKKRRAAERKAADQLAGIAAKNEPAAKPRVAAKPFRILREKLDARKAENAQATKSNGVE